jgi:membrane protein YdbS with pleckstrin-like domain
LQVHDERVLSPANDIFSPAGVEWTRVSPKLATARRLGRFTVLAVVTGGFAIGLTASIGWVIPTALSFGAAVWTWIWARRNQRSWAYFAGPEELLVTSRVMFRRLVAVPYGRMQFVDVKAGPIQRTLGIATVHLHTASQLTAAVIRGVPEEQAAQLRNQLTELGESRGAGV